MAYQNKHSFVPQGLDLRKSDFVKDPEKASGGQNYTITPSGHLIKRKGFSPLHFKSNIDTGYTEAGYGLFIHEKKIVDFIPSDGWGEFSWGEDPWGSDTNFTVGTFEKQLIQIAPTPSKWVTVSLTINANIVDTTKSYVSIYQKADGKYFKIEEVVGGVTTSILDFCCGTGVDQNIVTISDLVNQITVADQNIAYSAVAASADTTPAVALSIYSTTDALALSSTVASIVVNFGYWEDVNTSTIDPLASINTQCGSPGYTMPSAVNIEGVLYVASTTDELHKYDGQTFYRAGIPNIERPLVVENGAGTGLNGTYYWKAQYKQVDAVGNIVEGSLSEPSDPITTVKGATVTLQSIETGSGFNTGYAFIDGNQTSVNAGSGLETLTVDDGSGGDHTLKVGDRAFLYDTAELSHYALLVRYVTAKTITVESSITITLLDNQVVSNNLRLVIWRTTAGGSSDGLYYLVDEIPNNPTGSTTVYLDNMADEDLGALFMEPDLLSELPPKSKFLTVWNNNLVCAGNAESPNTLFFSDIDAYGYNAPEKFTGINYVNIAMSTGSTVTGIGVLGRYLLVFSDESVYVGEGIFPAIRFTKLSESAGCASHNTICGLENRIFWAGKRGIFRYDGKDLKRLSETIDPLFLDGDINQIKTSSTRARACIIGDGTRYIVSYPYENNVGSSEDIYNLTDTDEPFYARTYVWDDVIEQWYPWTGLDYWGGLVSWNDGYQDETVWSISRQKIGSDIYAVTSSSNNSRSELDYSDGLLPVDMSYDQSWYSAGDPSIGKHFIKLQLYSGFKSSMIGYIPTGTWSMSVDKNFNSDVPESVITFTITPTFPFKTKALKGNIKRSIRFKFANAEINKQVLLSGWTLSYYTNIDVGD